MKLNSFTLNGDKYSLPGIVSSE